MRRDTDDRRAGGRSVTDDEVYCGVGGGGKGDSKLEREVGWKEMGSGGGMG